MPPPHVIVAMMKHCRCCTCCQNPPCDGVMAGGLCDRQGCIYESRDEDDYDDEDDRP